MCVLVSEGCFIFASWFLLEDVFEREREKGNKFAGGGRRDLRGVMEGK